MSIIDFGNKCKPIDNHVIDIQRMQCCVKELQWLIDNHKNTVSHINRVGEYQVQNKINKLQSQSRVDWYKQYRLDRINKRVFNNWKREWSRILKQLCEETVTKLSCCNVLQLIDFDKCDYCVR